MQLPREIVNLIDQYVDELNEFTDLPDTKKVRKLIRRTNGVVLTLLGEALGLNAVYLTNLRYKLRLNDDFTFYFTLGDPQRVFLIGQLQHAIATNPFVSAMIWIFIVRKPALVTYPEYRQMFANSLYCKLMCYLNPRTP